MAARHVPRPDHVFVGNRTYQIMWFAEEEWDAKHLADDADGLTYAAQSMIYVRLRGEALEAHYQEVVFHEVTHACWDATMLTHYHDNVGKDDREEFIIGATTPALLFVLQQNPALVKWLTSNGAVRRG